MPQKRFNNVVIISALVVLLLAVLLTVILLINNSDETEVETFTTEQSDELIATDEAAAKEYVQELAADENQKIALALTEAGNLIREAKYQEALDLVEKYKDTYESLTNENKQRYLLIVVQSNSLLNRYNEAVRALEQYISISNFAEEPASQEYWNNALEQLKNNKNPFVLDEEQQ